MGSPAVSTNLEEITMKYVIALALFLTVIATPALSKHLYDGADPCSKALAESVGTLNGDRFTILLNTKKTYKILVSITSTVYRQQVQAIIKIINDYRKKETISSDDVKEFDVKIEKATGEFIDALEMQEDARTALKTIDKKYIAIIKIICKHEDKE